MLGMVSSSCADPGPPVSPLSGRLVEALTHMLAEISLYFPHFELHSHY